MYFLIDYSPTHQRQSLLPLHLRPLGGQLLEGLLLVGQCLLHQHHLDALLHRVLLGPGHSLLLLQRQTGQSTAHRAHGRPCADSVLDLAHLS